MKLRNKHAKLANVKLNLPIVGEVELKDGIVDVPKELHDLLIGDGLNEWTTGEEVNEEEAKKQADVKNDGDEYETMVNSLSFDQVKELAQEANIKNWQLFAKKEASLRTYVINRLRASHVENDKLEYEANKLKSGDIKNPYDNSDVTGSPLDTENV